MSHLFFLSALYIEAAPLIRKYNLNQKKFIKGYSCFLNEEGNVLLVVSGSGKMAMAGAAAAALQVYPCDHLIVFSSCAGLKDQKPGEVYLVNKVTDLETGRSWYPDLLYRSDLCEGSLLCGELPFGVNSEHRDVREPYDPEEYVHDYSYDLYDMDTSGAVLTARKFLGPHQISILKTVSDHGNLTDRTTYAQYMETGFEKAFPYMQMLMTMNPPERGEDEQLSAIGKEMHCSATMYAQLKQLFRYARASGQNLKDMLAEFYENGMLPCKSREEGKKVLHAIARKLTT